jgi:hypothetical protein
MGIEILHEQLSIDMAPLQHGQPVHVAATYQLQNHGSPRELELLFVSGSEHMMDFQARLGNHPLESRLANLDDVPPSWRPPSETPGFSGKDDLAYLRRRSYLAATQRLLSVIIPAGRSELEVRYDAEAARTFQMGGGTDWQFAYVLSPARDWDGFGGLDLTITIPEGWKAASRPLLTPGGNTLSAHFPRLPADALALTLRGPIPPTYHLVEAGSYILLGLACVTGWIACRRVGRVHRGRGWRAWLGGILAGFLWWIAVLVTGYIAGVLAGLIHPSAPPGYNSIRFFILYTIGPMGPLFVILGLAIVLLAARGERPATPVAG